MENYKIEKNIPIAKKKGGGRTAEDFYPLSDMNVGDSFLVPMKQYNHKERGKIASRIAMYSKRDNKNKKFSTRRVDEGVRVWRTK